MILSIIIISYNTKTLTQACLETCIKAIKKSQFLNHQSEIWVVDNHSSDDSRAMLKTLAQQNNFLKLILNQDNLGFAKANNQALKKAQGKYLLLLNSDTLPQKGSLEILVKSLAHFKNDEKNAVLSSTQNKLDNLGIVAAQLLNPDGSLQRQGGDLPNLLTVFNQMFFLDDLPFIGRFLPSTQHCGKNQQPQLDQKIIKKSWVAGTAMLIKKQVIEEIGLLDEAIFMYGEDMEFCLRANQHHYDIAIIPKALVLHYGSASSDSNQALRGEIKSLLYIFAKHKPIWQTPVLKYMLRLSFLLRIFIFATIVKNKQKVQVYQELLKELN